MSLGMYKGKKFQDKIRKKLLGFLEAMIRGDDETLTPNIAGMYSAAFHDALILFGDQLDLHNRCLLSNVKYQSDKIFYSLKSKMADKDKDKKKYENGNSF